jgi:beta-1,4-mannosyltransferase
VLHSVRASARATNPFVALTLACVPGCVRSLPFSWRTALLGRYDLVHVQWVEGLTGGRSRPVRLVKQVLTALLLLRLAARRTPVVQTLHNTAPHEPEGAVARLLRAGLDHRTTTRIAMSAATPAPPRGRTVRIPHGHYRPCAAGRPPAEPVPGALLHFGLVRPYKDVPALVRAFRATTDPGLTLDVVGRPLTAGLAREVERAAAGDPRITLELDHVPDAELAARVERAELVVLAHRDMHNSGSALLALSLDRPVLVPRTAATDELRDEVGPAWVLQYAPPLTPDALERAVAACRARGGVDRPDLSAREWDAIGRQLADCYRTTLAAP